MCETFSSDISDYAVNYNVDSYHCTTCLYVSLTRRYDIPHGAGSGVDNLYYRDGQLRCQCTVRGVLQMIATRGIPRRV